MAGRGAFPLVVCEEPKSDGRRCGTVTPRVPAYDVASGRRPKELGERWRYCPYHAAKIAQQEGSVQVSGEYVLTYTGPPAIDPERAA
jgi:hypothetical protein